MRVPPSASDQAQPPIPAYREWVYRLFGHPIIRVRMAGFRTLTKIIAYGFPFEGRFDRL
jgi:hypothetical protein